MLKVSPLKPGELAPNFDYTDIDGSSKNTADLKGQSLLVYFYPRDDTPGCTTEACGFRDSFDSFQQANITIIGVSCDNEKSHEKFRNKYNLPFALASDEDQSIVKAYGVWGEKKFMGKTFEGIHRISFLVDTEGVIAKVYPKVKPAKHAQEILDDAEITT